MTENYHLALARALVSSGEGDRDAEALRHLDTATASPRNGFATPIARNVLGGLEQRASCQHEW